MNILRTFINWISRVEELQPQKAEDRRTYVERRKTHVGYEGAERRSGTDRRTHK
jgi:hypothetical protein